jgi:hypothetical protein
MQEADQDRDGKISFEEFRKIINDCPLAESTSPRAKQKVDSAHGKKLIPAPCHLAHCGANVELRHCLSFACDHALVIRSRCKHVASLQLSESCN